MALMALHCRNTPLLGTFKVNLKLPVINTGKINNSL